MARNSCPSPPFRAIGRTLVLCVPLCQAAVAGQAWTGSLPGGGEIQVDPETHRATRVDGGRSMPMWDGTHRLEDGSVVIIRDGTAVPTEQMLQTWDGRVPVRDELAGKPCERLVRQTCGYDNACANSTACLNARRLLNSERDAQRRAPLEAGQRPSTPVSAECDAASASADYPPCASGARAAVDTPCRRLVERVCGVDDRCSGSSACDPARQLLRMEAEEQQSYRDPLTVTPSGVQCREAMTNQFFAPCP